MTEQVNNKWSAQNNPLMLEMEKVRLGAGRGLFQGHRPSGRAEVQAQALLTQRLHP